MEKNLNGKELAAFVLTKIGTPYVYGAKPNQGVLTQARLDSLAKSYPKYFSTTNYNLAKKSIGKVCCDCSGLPSWYTGIYYGSAQYYSKAKERIPISQVKNFPIGTILWKEGHIGVYIGMENGVPMCVEAKGTKYGTVKTKVSATKWQYGLIMSYIGYTNDNTNKSEVSNKAKNPYPVPTKTVYQGCKGNDVKWLQYELIEAGYTKVKVNGFNKTVTIDGSFGPITLAALKAYQSSAKLVVDGRCGKLTRESLIKD